MKNKKILLLILMTICMAAIACAEYNATYTAEDLPKMAVDYLATIPIQFMFLGLYRLVEFSIIIYLLVLAAISGVKWVIHKIEGGK